VLRAVQAANADIVYAGAYPPDSVGIVRAANEIGLNPKIFGGALIGQLVTPIKVQLGPVQNGIIITESFVPSAKLKTDPIGYAFVPLGYAAGEVLAQAITATKSLDHEVLAKYLHANTFKTVVGEIGFGKDGEWSKQRMVVTQFQNIEPNNLDQFRTGAKQPILWPPDYKTGDMIYPYSAARQK
jgi:branched-chain amino acid transport system substrate-binding protein